MLFAGYLYGIRSERRLEEEINCSFACKWFCGLGLTNSIVVNWCVQKGAFDLMKEVRRSLMVLFGNEE